MEGRLLREQQIICDESEAAGAPTPETTGSGRARGKRTRNGNQFSLERKNSIFLSVEKCYFGFCPNLFSFLPYLSKEAYG